MDSDTLGAGLHRLPDLSAAAHKKWVTTQTPQRVSRGVPTGGQFAAQDRAEAEVALAARPAVPDLIEQLRDGKFGTFDDGHEAWLLTPGDLNLPAVNHLAIAGRLYEAIESIDDPEALPVVEVPTSSLRLADDQLRADALAWYLGREDDSEHWDDQVSFYGAAGPLAVKRGDEYWLVDGNHRAARAIITGQDTFRLQAFELEETR